MTIEQIINKITEQILNPVVILLFVLATIVFIWGIIQYVIGSQGDTGKLEKAKNTILYGIIGMFIMASAWGIVTILQDFFKQ